MLPRFNSSESTSRADADPRYAGRVLAAGGHDDHIHIDLQVPEIE